MLLAALSSLPPCQCRQLLAAQGRALGVRSAWQLASEVLPVKFAAALAPSLLAFIAHVEGEVLLCCGSLRRCLALMTAHRSQWVWCVLLYGSKGLGWGLRFEPGVFKV
jgi:hypothetical protein